MYLFYIITEIAHIRSRKYLSTDFTVAKLKINFEVPRDVISREYGKS